MGEGRVPVITAWGRQHGKVSTLTNGLTRRHVSCGQAAVQTPGICVCGAAGGTQGLCLSQAATLARLGWKFLFSCPGLPGDGVPGAPPRLGVVNSRRLKQALAGSQQQRTSTTWRCTTRAHSTRVHGQRPSVREGGGRCRPQPHCLLGSGEREPGSARMALLPRFGLPSGCGGTPL